MVTSIFEDFEPPFKNFVATPLDHPNKYSYEIPHETCWGEGTNLFPKAIFKSSLPLIEKRCARDKVGWGNLSGKTVSIKRNLWFVLGFFFFKWCFSFVATFSEQLYFWRSFFFTLLQSNYFGTTTTFSEQLFLQNCCFLWGASFFRTVIYSEQLFF